MPPPIRVRFPRRSLHRCRCPDRSSAASRTGALTRGVGAGFSMTPSRWRSACGRGHRRDEHPRRERFGRADAGAGLGGGRRGSASRADRDFRAIHAGTELRWPAPGAFDRRWRAADFLSPPPRHRPRDPGVMRKTSRCCFGGLDGRRLCRCRREPERGDESAAWTKDEANDRAAPRAAGEHGCPAAAGKAKSESPAGCGRLGAGTRATRPAPNGIGCRDERTCQERAALSPAATTSSNTSRGTPAARASSSR